PDRRRRRHRRHDPQAADDRRGGRGCGRGGVNSRRPAAARHAGRAVHGPGGRNYGDGVSPPGANPSHVEHWVFDLDNTLYPPECEFMALVEGRITDFVVRESGLPRDEALSLQKRYLHEHGTSLAGLMAHYDIDPHRFLDEVHDVSLDCLRPDAALRRGLERLPGRRLVFTNGSARHAERVLDRLGVADLFEDVFHLEAAELIPKPDPRTFDRMIRRHAV